LKSAKKRKKRYPSNLSDGAWNELKPHWPDSVVGRPREVSLRQVVNAILYVLKTGGQWRQLPREFPPWSAVYYYFRRWSRDGTWARIHDVLRARLRERSGRHKHPTAACLDSQSVKGAATFPVSGAMMPERRSRGVSATSLMDTLGLLLAVVVRR
jgi:putative transposase